VLLRRAGKGAEGKTARLSRYYGKQFGVAPPKKGQVRPPAAPPDQFGPAEAALKRPRLGQVAKDVYFDDFKRLYEVRARSPPDRRSAAAPGPDRAGAAQGEKYVNPGKVETESQVANNAGKIGGDWKPNSPPKKKCAPASAHTTQTLPLARASA